MPTSTSEPSLDAALRAEAFGAGFHALGVVRPDAGPDARLHDWVDAGYHGSMTWMAERMAWRADPAALWPAARSIIMLAHAYTPDRDPLAVLEARDRAAISVYAGGRDYHDVVKKRLKRVGRWLIDRAGGQIKVFVDTAPVMEKPLAEAAGLGWQGRHTNLVSRDLGSWFFLGAIFTTLELAPSRPGRDRCGTCRACLDICPTAAFPRSGVLDARRCISYLTIEHKGPIPRGMRAAMGNRVYGCDDCLAVCPWNKFADRAHDGYQTRPALRDPALRDLLDLDDARFRALFRGSPIKRIGVGRFLRNVLIAAGNSGDTGLIDAVRRHLRDADPVVRGAAVWALARLAPDALPPGSAPGGSDPDPDPDVAREWHHALALGAPGHSG